MDFLADDKTDSGLHQLGRKRSRRVWFGRETVNYEAIVDAKPPTGECPFEVSSGFEAIGFFQHSWGCIRSCYGSLEGDFVTAFGATTVQGPLSAGGGHSGAEAADATSFALSPFEGAFHEGNLLT